MSSPDPSPSTTDNEEPPLVRPRSMMPRSQRLQPGESSPSHTSRAIVIPACRSGSSLGRSSSRSSSPKNAFNEESFESMQSTELFDGEHDLDCRLGAPSPLFRSTTSGRFAEGESIEVAKTRTSSSTNLRSRPLPRTPETSASLVQSNSDLEKAQLPPMVPDIQPTGTAPTTPDSVVVAQENAGNNPTTTAEDEVAAEVAAPDKQWSQNRRWCWYGGAALVVVLVVVVVAVLVVTGNNKSATPRGTIGEQEKEEEIAGSGVKNNTIDISNSGDGISPTVAPTWPQPSNSPTMMLPSSQPSAYPTIEPTIPPLNDECRFARGPLTINRMTPYKDILNQDEFSLTATTRNSNNNNNWGRNCPMPATTSGLWYTVTGGDQVLQASTCDSTEASQTRLFLYQGEDCQNLQCVPDVTTAPCASGSWLIWYAQKGVAYSLLVTTTSLQANVNFSLRIAYPTNDECSSALGPLPTNTTVSTTTMGSLEAAPPDQPALLTCSFQFAAYGYVWYSVVGTGEWMAASTCLSSSKTDFPARLDVTAGCATGGCPAVKDSKCGKEGYRIVWESQMDVVYYLVVFKTINLPGSLFGLHVETFAPVENDECVNAISIDTDGTLVRGSTWNATQDGVAEGLGDDCPYYQQPGVWYSVMGTGETLLASTCNDETDFASQITILRGGNCDSNRNMECVPTQTQFCGEKASVYWESENNVEYRILVHGADYGASANVGDFGLQVGTFVPAENDVCESALPVDSELLQGSTFFATTEEVPSCDGLDGDAPGVWYTVQGTGSVLRAATCDPATNFDTKISIYQGSCQDLTCVIADDNSCGIQSNVRWTARAGVTYHILVHGRRSSFVGDFGLIVEEYTPTVANDFCDGALPVTVNGELLVGSTTTAYFDNAGVCGGVRNSAAGVWYRVEGTGTRLEASLCHPETDYDTSLSVFTGECATLDCIAGNSDSGDAECGRTSTVSWVSQPGSPYWLLVHGYDVRVGNFGLTVEEPPSEVPNDFCVRATPLSIGKDVIEGTTVGAYDDEAPSCTGVDQTEAGVWYTVVGNGDYLVASTCNGDSGRLTEINTKMSVYTGNCGNLECARADDNGCGFQSRVVWKTEPGVTYYILVHGYSKGSFGLTVDRFVSQQKNDFCVNAHGPILANDKVIYGSTVGTSFDYMETCGASNTGPGVWYMVFGTGERLKADTCHPYTNFDTKLSVYTGLDCQRLQCLGGNDDGCGLQSSLTFDTEIGELYYVLVHGWGTNREGRFGLIVSGSDIFR